MKNKKNIPALRFPGFEGEWLINKLSDISENGFSNGVFNDPKKVGHGYRLINVKDMYLDNVINVNNLTLVNINKSEFDKNKVEYGDILFTRSSLVKEGIAYSCVYLSNDDDITFDGHLIRMRPNKIKTSPIFLAYNFKTKNSRSQFIKKGKTTTMTTIGQDDIATVEISLPSLTEQQKIASFLTSVDERIQQLTRKKNLLEQYKKGVMQKIFSREIKFKDDKGKNFPEWEEKNFSDFLTLTLREVDKPDSNYLAIGVRSHFKGTFHKIDSEPEKIAMDKLYVVKENDLVVNITFAWEGAVAIVKEEDDGGLVSHRFPTYIFNKSITDHNYFQHILSDKKLKLMLELISPGGAGRNRVMSKPDFLQLKWSLPCLQEQQKIASFLSSIDKKIDLVNTQLEKSKAWKKGLLQKMFV